LSRQLIFSVGYTVLAQRAHAGFIFGSDPVLGQTEDPQISVFSVCVCVYVCVCVCVFSCSLMKSITGTGAQSPDVFSARAPVCVCVCVGGGVRSLSKV